MQSIVSKVIGDTIIKIQDVQVEATKEGSVFKKAKSIKAPRILVISQYKVYLFDSSGKSLKEKKV